jgi:uncharacterized phage protein (TIGR02216 family)
MAFAVRAFGIEPEAFWRMSFRELRELAQFIATPASTAPSRGNLEELMARFPDRGAAKGEQDGNKG